MAPIHASFAIAVGLRWIGHHCSAGVS